MPWLMSKDERTIVTASGKSIVVHVFQGEYQDGTAYSETRVSSSGGGGYVSKHGGHVAAPTVTSHVTHHREFFLKDEEQEKAFHLQDVKFAARPGHIVTVAWAIGEGNEKGPFIFVKNQNTGEKYLMRASQQVREILAVGCLHQMLLIAALPIMFIAGLTFFLARPEVQGFILSARMDALIILAVCAGLWIKSYLDTSAIQTLVGAKIAEIEAAADLAFSQKQA